MALRRKGSRPIRVNGATYRWTVSASVQATSGTVVVVVRSESPVDPGIAVHVPCRDFYLDLPGIDPGAMEFDADNYRPIRPADVRAIILAAREQGWTSGKADGQLVFDYDRSRLTRRSGRPGADSAPRE
jgi:hypothetical protein